MKDIIEILSLLDLGMSGSQVAKMYGVSESFVSRVLSGQRRTLYTAQQSN